MAEVLGHGMLVSSARLRIDDLRAVDAVQRFDDWLTLGGDKPEEQGALAGAASLVRGAGRRIRLAGRASGSVVCPCRRRPRQVHLQRSQVGEAVSGFQFG